MPRTRRLRAHKTLTAKLPKAALALAVTSALLLAGCSAQNTGNLDATNILQNVNVKLDSAAKVSDINADIVSIDGISGKIVTDQENYSVRDAVNDLPVRVTTRYKTTEKSGDNLSDLKGYTGKVVIEVSVENLTVASKDLTYDVAGVQRTQKALVGIPLTVAGSAQIEGVKPQNIRADATLGTGSTNGVISSSQEGNTQVQWGAILAGPATGASTTFVLDMDVNDFKVPSIDLAVQAGLTNDLTASGIIGAATNPADSSDLDLIRRTVEVVNEANAVLTDAGSTITAVRDNLNKTSESLEASTVRSLQDASSGLTQKLEDLQEKLGNLNTDLAASTQSSQTEIVGQMQQTVDALTRFLGTEPEEIPQAQIDSGTCKVQITQPAGGATVYSNMVQLSNVLSAYGQANTDCRDQMIATMNQIIGPENPSAQTCADSPSVSCSFYASSLAVTASMIAMAAQGNELIEELQPGMLTQALADYESTNRALENLEEKISALDGKVDPTPTPSPSDSSEPTAEPSASETPAPPTPSPTEPSDTDRKELLAGLTALEDSVSRINTSLESIQDLVRKTHATGANAVQKLEGETAEAGGSMIEQNKALAHELCAISDQLSPEQLQTLRGYLTDEPCSPHNTPAPTTTAENTATATATSAADQTPGDTENTPAPSETTAPGHANNYKQPMDQRLNDQLTMWKTVLNSTNLDQEGSQIQQNFSAVSNQTGEISQTISEMKNRLNQTPEEEPSPTAEPSNTPTGSPSAEPTIEPTAEPTESPGTDPAIQAVKDALPQLRENTNTLGQSLETVNQNQEQLNQAIKALLENAPAETAQEINELLGSQVRQVSAAKEANAEAITEMFSDSISDLTGSARIVSAQADSLAQEQGQALKEEAENQAATIDRRTQDALVRIQESTNAATRDADGASAVLTSQLQNIMLDVGDSSIDGSGLLGSLTTGAAKAGDADYQLTLATENAQRYANIREEDLGAIRLKQAQHSAAFAAVADMPAFKLATPQGATVKTLYTFSLGGK